MADGGADQMRSVSPDEDSRAYRDALGRFATGVTVVTCQSELGALGITANSFASVSLDPPLVLWSPARASRRFPAFATADRFAIHVLGEEEEPLCRRFSADGTDFDGLDWSRGVGETPLIEGCLARFECETVARHDGGDHLIVVARVARASWRPGRPLVFHGGQYGRFTNSG